MVQIGKEIFGDHVSQLVTIVVSLSLAIVAQKLSGDIANMSFITFIMDGYGLMDSNPEVGFFSNILLPFVMYFLSCALLLWIGICNLVTCNDERDKSNVVLKAILGYLQLIMFGMLLVMSGTLFAYFMLLIFTALILTLILDYAASYTDMEKST
ncbi:hypothetical protein [Aquibacillus salsiterrae]|uniref:Uncharacterized protein n=1 Tax=Aquibacillus salsiterrae TaxID=2950439 RepID=A0A9X3WFV5_9BACI|nr:hypothetical protein [Aquibacillus salsiterrae]MDC3418243.1 hypothetical protein [Aquibacillus salsiterrae]